MGTQTSSIPAPLTLDWPTEHPSREHVSPCLQRPRMGVRAGVHLPRLGDLQPRSRGLPGMQTHCGWWEVVQAVL